MIYNLRFKIWLKFIMESQIMLGMIIRFIVEAYDEKRTKTSAVP